MFSRYLAGGINIFSLKVSGVFFEILLVGRNSVLSKPLFNPEVISK